MEPKIQGMNINENCCFKYSTGNQDASPGHRHLRMFQRFLKLYFHARNGENYGASQSLLFFPCSASLIHQVQWF